MAFDFGSRRKCAPLATLLLVAYGAAALAEGASLPATAVKEIDTVARAAVQSQTVGLIVGISKNGRIVFSKGYGKASLELDSPMTADSVVRIASVSKQFTAAAVLSLVEEGKLSLDDTVSQVVPSFPGSEAVTIQRLLNHTSGIRELLLIPGYTGKEWRIDRSPEEMIQYIASHSPLHEFQPGTAWAYSNSGYQLLGLIVEKASGMSMKVYYQQRLFDRIGLRHTAIDDPGDIVPLRAAGYDRLSKDSAELRNAAYLSMSAPGAAGFLRSTVGDLLEWTAALFAGRVIRPELVQRMIEPARLNDGSLASEHIFVRPDAPKPKHPREKHDYGLGLEVANFDGHEKIGHSGSIPGFLTRMDYFPREALAVVVIVNTAGGMQDLPQIIERIALKHL